MKLKRLYPKTGLFCIFLLLLLFVSRLCLQGQSIVENPIIGEESYLDNPFTNEQLVHELINFSGIGRSSSIIGYESLNSYNACLWNTESFDEDRYFTFTITPNTDCYIDFVSFDYEGETSSTGPDKVTLRSSLDGFTSDIGEPSTGETHVDLSGEYFQNVDSEIEFRLYAWGATTIMGTFRIIKFVFNGYVFDFNCMVPAVPGIVSGTEEAYPRQENLEYNVEIERADKYLWSVTEDATICEGQGTNTVVVNAGERDFYITVEGENECGPGPLSLQKNIIVDYPLLYHHGFGEEADVEHPYIAEPNVMDEHLSNSVWTNTNETWSAYAGATGNPDKALWFDNLLGEPTITLMFDVSEGYQMKITAFNFWRRSSDTGPTEWSLSINNTLIGIGLSSYGSYIKKNEVLNPVSGLTGNVAIELKLTGATSASGTFRIDDFMIYGLVDCVPIDIDSPEDVEVCGAYELPELTTGNYFTGRGGTGDALFAGDVIANSQIIFVYAQCDAAPECYDENSFEVIVHEQITTNPITRVD
jgi:hypothetical protein